jgi:peptidoglycan hydrolase-like protein with peptidoglycan-binding domain
MTTTTPGRVLRSVTAIGLGLVLSACGPLGVDDAAGPATSSPVAQTSPPPPAIPEATPTTVAPTPTVTVTPTTAKPTTAAPKPTPAAPKPSPTVTKPPPPKRTTLILGDQGPEVLAMQKRLRDLGYWLGEPDGHYGGLTQQAVWAFQKAAGLGVDGIVGPGTKRAMDNGLRPRAQLSGDGVEIDLGRQLLMIVRGGRAQTILNTSTGGGYTYDDLVNKGNTLVARTPTGRFRVNFVVDGPDDGPYGSLYRPRYFAPGIAVHGSPSIPPYPASHGCARVSNAAINMIWANGLMPMGSRVYVH